MQLTLEQAATRLGKTKRQVLYMIQTQRLPANPVQDLSGTDDPVRYLRACLFYSGSHDIGTSGHHTVGDFPIHHPAMKWPGYVTAPAQAGLSPIDGALFCSLATLSPGEGR